MPADGVDDKTLREALEAVGLTALGGRSTRPPTGAPALPRRAAAHRLRAALVQKPDWLFLDEATSALDEETEESLYRLVRERLPKAMVFSIGHRTTLGPFHARRLMVEPVRAGPPPSWKKPAARDGA